FGDVRPPLQEAALAREAIRDRERETERARRTRAWDARAESVYERALRRSARRSGAGEAARADRAPALLQAVVVLDGRWRGGHGGDRDPARSAPRGSLDAGVPQRHHYFLARSRISRHCEDSASSARQARACVAAEARSPVSSAVRAAR